jgi:hypothetical protein
LDVARKTRRHVAVAVEVYTGFKLCFVGDRVARTHAEVLQMIPIKECPV